MKKSILLFIVIISIIRSDAQFQCDVGLGLARSGSKVQNFMRPLTLLGTTIRDTFFYSYNVTAGGYGLYVYPKYHLTEVGTATISLGAPILLGMAGSSKRPEGSTQKFLYDFSLALDLNGGRLNRRQDYPDKPVGYFIGIGLGVMNTKGIGYTGGIDNNVNENTKDIILVPETGYVSDFMKAQSSGLLFHGGMVAPINLDKENTKSIGLRFFVKPGLGRNQLTYYGFNLYVTFSNDRGY